MMNSRIVVESLSSSDLRSATRELVRGSHGVEAALLVHLGEIDERKLYLDWAFSSMFAFCVGELSFSEDVACNRINVARAARRRPVILEAAAAGSHRGAKARAFMERARVSVDRLLQRRPGFGQGECRIIRPGAERAALSVRRSLRDGVQSRSP